MNDTEFNEDGHVYHIISKLNNALAIIVFISFGIAYALILSYFDNLPLEKKCLLLHLYKDVFTSIIVRRLTLIIQAFLSNWNIIETSKSIALIITFVLWCGALYMAFILMFIGVYRLYLAKTKSVDPNIPWLEDEESKTMWKIRMAGFLFIIGFLSTTFGMGLYPNTFYAMIQDHESKQDPLISNVLYRGTVSFLWLVSGITTIAKKCYEPPEEIQIDKVIPKGILYIATISFVLLGCLAIADAFHITDNKTTWKCYHSIISIVLIFIPFILIATSDELKAHSVRIIKNIYDEAFLLNIYLMPPLLSILIIVFLFVLI